MSGIDDFYPALRDAWIGGAGALDHVPAQWAGVVQGVAEDEAQRRLLALAGQALEVSFRPAPPPMEERRPDLPRLTKPVMPERCRGLFRAAMTWQDVGAKLRLVEARGYSAHPFDWFPKAADDDIPDMYQPWKAWLAGEPAEDEAGPAEGLVRLRAMRYSAPDRARELIVAQAGQARAEARLKLVAVLGTNLGPADQPYLESLAKDRSGKVKELAGRLLSRLGTGQAAPEDLKELASYAKVATKGLLSRQIVVTMPKLDNRAQLNHRQELFNRCTLADLAQALGMGPDELVRAYRFDDRTDSEILFANLVRDSGSDAAVNYLAPRLVKTDPQGAFSLAARATRETQRATVLALLTDTAEWPSWIRNPSWGELQPDLIQPSDILGSNRFKCVLAKPTTFMNDVWGLGYCCTAPAATAVLAALVATGLRPQEPLLAPLRLNVELALT